jgi:Caspase domain
MRTRLISTFLLLFATSFVIYSQDIYRLKYKSPDAKDTATYDAYFSLSANGTGIVRVKPVTNRNFIAELQIEESYAKDKDGMPDLKYVVYEGKNPRVVMRDQTIQFSPVTFWFKINADNFYDPWAVTPVSVNSAPSESNFLSIEFIKSQDLPKKKDLVATFFADTSIYYKNIFGTRSRGGMLTPEEKQNTHLYLVVVASTNDPSLQPNCLIDARKVINFFGEIANNVLGFLPRNIFIDSIFGNNYSRANVELALKKIHPTKNDLVIFYYSGHGFHDKKYPEKVFPFFDLRDPTKPKFFKDLETQTLNVKDIYDTILAKGARFNLVLSDCCNDTVARPKRKWWETTKKKGLTKANFDNVKALFMNKQPVNYLMTAASKDEEAVVTPSFNSYFTFFFLQSLATYLSPEKGFPTWPQVLAATQIQTIRQVSGLPCKEINCPKQTPKMLIPGIR